MNTYIYGRFMKILREEGLANPSWIWKLDELDTPPLFCYFSQVEFLRAFPPEESAIETLGFALSALEMFASTANVAPANREIHLYLSVYDFDNPQDGECPIPDFRFCVNRTDNDKEPNRPDGWAVAPYTPDGLAVARWLDALGPYCVDRYCVAEVPPEEYNPELRQVYVGWKSNPAPNIKSAGDMLRATRVDGPELRDA